MDSSCGDHGMEQFMPESTLRHSSSIQSVAVVYIECPPLQDEKTRSASSVNAVLVPKDGLRDNFWVATGDSSGSVAIWDPTTRRICALKNGVHCSRYGVLHVELVENRHELILTQGRDGRIRAWKWFDTKLDKVVFEHHAEAVWEVDTGSRGFCSMTILSDFVASTCSDPAFIKIWNLDCSECLIDAGKPEPQSNSGMCMSLKLVNSGSKLAMYLLALFEAGNLYIFDLASKAWKLNLTMQLRSNVPISMDIVNKSYSRTKFLGIACGVDSKVSTFSIDFAGEKVKVHDPISLRTEDNEERYDEAKRGFSMIRISPNSRIAACAGWDGSINLIDWRKPKLLGNLYHHKKNLRCLTFLPNGIILLSGGEDGHVALWRLPNSFAVKPSEAHDRTKEDSSCYERRRRTKCIDMLQPQTYVFNGVRMEISAHIGSKTILRDLKYIFGDDIVPMGDIKLIPVLQETKNSMLDICDEIAQEKDQCLQNFVCIAKRFCDFLHSRGRWADYCDPCSGLPTYSNRNVVYSEIEGLEKVRNFRTSNAANCRVVLHPTWGPNMYPATLFTNADESEIMEALSLSLGDNISTQDNKASTQDVELSMTDALIRSGGRPLHRWFHSKESPGSSRSSES